MATYRLTETGDEVEDRLAKVQAIKGIAGIIVCDGAGNFSALSIQQLAAQLISEEVIQQIAYRVQDFLIPEGESMSVHLYDAGSQQVNWNNIDFTQFPNKSLIALIGNITLPT